MSGRGCGRCERALRNVVCEGFDDSVILPPGAVMTGNHEMYKVFTPVENFAAAETAGGRMPECVAAPKVRSSGWMRALAIHYADSPRQSFDTAHFPVEEKAAMRNYASFARTVPEIMSDDEIFRQWKAPAVCRPTWRRAGLSPRQCLHQLVGLRTASRRWTVGPVVSGLVS
ncbi:hypothetical protein ACLK19_04875 [Escherichia coli]